MRNSDFTQIFNILDEFPTNATPTDQRLIHIKADNSDIYPAKNLEINEKLNYNKNHVIYLVLII